MEYIGGGMDAELREYLDGKFRQVDERFEQVDEKLVALEQRIDEKLVALSERFDDKLTALAQHLLHEMDTRFSLVDKKLESMDSRLKLQAGLIQTGSRAIARLSDYSENSEARWVDLTIRFDSLERRVDKLDPPAQH
jgi:chromosome segregation ATPase